VTMSTLYCSNCKINLPTDDSLKEHYKSEFHRYNIKRHLVNLAPISQEQFLKKKTEVVEGRRAETQTVLKCDVCKKNFASKPTYKQHMESKKHQEALSSKSSSPQKEGEIEISAEEKKPRVRITTMEDQSVCLFCNEKSSDVNENLVHMRLKHSFFVSDIKYVKDLNGLLKYLGEKIHRGCLCIFCENHHCKDFKSGDAVQCHMIDKGHCFMKTENFDEYYKFYDFSKSLEEMRNKMYIGDADEPLKEGEAYYEYESGDDEDDEHWESDGEDDIEEEDEEGEDGEKLEKKKEAAEGEENEEKKPRRVYRYKVRKVKVLDSGEIQLPNGTILGHRKYRHLYKQYFRESMAKSHFRHNFLGYSEERALARLDRENRLMEMKGIIEKRLKMKEHFDNARNAVHWNYSQMKQGIRQNKIQPHYKNANPL